MSSYTTYQCDECEVNCILDGIADEPAGWISVEIHVEREPGEDDAYGQVYLFCGWACLSMYSTRCVLERGIQLRGES